ncbi:RagB/SusD family nutrient uptake outer membrane protein [Mucilaginibacter terrenus]|uniref:RagB/SusD family nutrient uptake outer membrane protein n=1 Tax=Mucilaginibacter terrenus TaxID=2482727 RepID=A0A3E2NJI3_9SPHI|nr:RagB/SusD family nutrient uptake outer membrane protein [Mucilaginibacter terrenus]RFZ81090.1 RagB/SusD family nutrient uptake outer membrane protein [Mucilaginibacter terrenus]
MKRFNHKLIIIGSVATLAFSMSCKKFLDKTPTNTLNSTVLANKAGVDGLLIGAYALVDGSYNGQPGATWSTGTDNWIYGSVAADDAHKGSTPGDQPDAAAIESRTPTATNGYLDPKWRVMFNGVQRANDVLREIPLVKDGSLSADNIAQVTAEAKFLRAMFHFEMAKIWRNVPYADETVTYDNGNYNIGNPGPIWDKIAADFAAAAAVLPETQPQVGRANKWAAKAFQAKALMYDHKYTEALAILKDVIANGKTAGGAKYALGKYANNFNPSTKNGPEGVFVAQTSVKDGANGLNGNAGSTLNFPSGGPATCCGFFQPSFSLANAFKTDPVTGLPLVDTYNNTDLKNDQGIDASAAFTPSTETLDSRIDWTIGRRGIPYLDWGLHPGKAWARDQEDGGPYSPIKNVYYQAAQASTSDTYGGWAANQSTANSYNIIRFADVILWAAECEVEVGSLENARAYVNQIRTRAADATGWVHTYVDDTKPTGGYTSTPAANYKVGLYPAGSFTDKATARKYVQFERRLEFGMEGHRFFDLQRWDGITGGQMGNGFMAAQINAYLDHENHVPNFPIELIKQAKFTAGKNELFPIPQGQIDVTQGAIKQNPGY